MGDTFLILLTSVNNIQIIDFNKYLLEIKMFASRTPKSQQAYKSIYVSHNPHTISLSNRCWPDRIRIISIDPGISHFCLRIEERSTTKHDIIKTLLHDKFGLAKEKQELDNDNVCSLYTFILPFLEQNKELFKTCHIVLIEKQLPQNYRMIRMSQHVLTYFMMLLRDVQPSLPVFLEIAPTLKSKELGAPPHINERGVKIWAVEKATELLTIREDTKGLEILRRKVNGRKEKKDDISDTILMIESVFSHFGWPTTVKINTVNLKIPSKEAQTIAPKLDIQTPTIQTPTIQKPMGNQGQATLSIKPPKIVLV